MAATDNGPQHWTYSKIRCTLLPPLPALLPLPLIPSFAKTPSPLFPAMSSAIASYQLHPSLEACLHILNNDLPSAHFLVRHMQDKVPLDQEKDFAFERRTACEAQSQRVWAASGSSHPTTTDGVFQSPQSGGVVFETHQKPSAVAMPGCVLDELSNVSGDATISRTPKIEGLLLHAALHRVEGDYENAKAWYRNTQSSASDSASIRDEETVPENAFAHTWPGGLDDVLDFVARISDLRKHKSARGGVINDDDEKELAQLHRKELSQVLEWCERRYGTYAWLDARSEFVGMGQKHKDIAGKMIVGGEGWRQF